MIISINTLVKNARLLSAVPSRAEEIDILFTTDRNL